MPLLTDELSRKRILRFAGLALLYYVLLMLPWPGLASAYGACFRITGNIIFNSFGDGGAVKFAPSIQNSQEQGTEQRDALVLIRKIGGSGVRAHASSRYMGYLSAALVTALVLATPLRRRRKLWALGGGLLLVHCFVALRVALWLINIDRKAGLTLFSFGDWSRTVVAYAGHILVTIPETKFVVPVAVWALVCFRREDFTAAAQTNKTAGKSPG
ncbi:MAG: hypothetical protein GXP29_02430 [Planctomycetes bacterium]|nr:hypothetical protein [Planctomycetota bacterium]